MALILGLQVGHVSFYDKASNMHFRLDKVIQEVPEGVPLEGLRRAVSNRTLFIIEGEFPNEDKKKEVAVDTNLELPNIEDVPAEDIVAQEELAEELEEDNADPTRCQGTVASGAQCKRKALEGELYCATHKKTQDE